MTTPLMDSTVLWDKDVVFYNKVLENCHSQSESTSSQQQACLQRITVFISDQDFLRWTHVGFEHDLSSHLRIALFLLNFYERQKVTRTCESACQICHQPLPLTCSACHDTSPLPYDNLTCVSPVQDGDCSAVSPRQQSNNTCDSAHSDMDKNGLQTLSPYQSTGESSTEHPSSLVSTDLQDLLSGKANGSSGILFCSTKTAGHSTKYTEGHIGTQDTQRLVKLGRLVFKAKQQYFSLRTRQKHSICKEKEKMFECRACKAVFKKRYSLKQHVVSSHIHDFPFVCGFCGQFCSNSTDLDTHTRTSHTLFECSACSATFTNDVKYKAHVHKLHPGLKPHRCQLCDKAYTSKQSLIFHCQKMHTSSPPEMDGILSSDANGRYQCHACDAVFHRQSLLKVHVTSHRSHIPFLCNVCGLPCTDNQHLSQHRLTHTPFQCPVCPAQFAYNTKYTAHIRKQHPGVKAHKCPHCDMAFDTRKWLTVHLLKHTGERPHLCPECGKSFTEAQVLQRHRLAMHQGTRTYSCSKCNKAFKTSSALAYHRRSHGSDKPSLCDQCGRTFLCPKALVAHKKKCQVQNDVDDKDDGQALCDIDSNNADNTTSMESDQQLFECPDCGTSFKGQQWLYRHLMNKPAACSKKFACEFCPRVFKDNRNFVRHVRVHTGEKPFTCEVCKARFTTRSDLYRHSRTHSGVKPYSCQHCHQQFRFRCDLTTHLRTHSGETPYPCMHCDSAFISASQRLQHMRTKHKSLISGQGTPRRKTTVKDCDTDSECAVALAAVQDSSDVQSAV